HGVVALEPRFQLGRKLQPVDKLLARGRRVLRFHFLGDFAIALAQNIEGELTHGFGARRRRRYPGDKIERTCGRRSAALSGSSRFRARVRGGATQPGEHTEKRHQANCVSHLLMVSEWAW